MAEISKHVGISSERILKTRQGKKMKQLLTIGEKKTRLGKKGDEMMLYLLGSTMNGMCQLIT